MTLYKQAGSQKGTNLDKGNRTDINELDITYNSQEQLWYCCSTNSDGSANCSNPTSENFSGPSPIDLSTIYPEPTSSSPSSTSPGISVSPSAQSTFTSATFSSTTIASLSSSTTSDSQVLPSSSGAANGNVGSGLDVNDKVTTGLTIGVGLPGTIAGIAGAYFGYAAVKRRRGGNPGSVSTRPRRP